MVEFKPVKHTQQFTQTFQTKFNIEIMGKLVFELLKLWSLVTSQL